MTGLAFGAVSRSGQPLDTVSRSWPQCEALKAAIGLDGHEGLDLKPEIEARVARLFRWHIDPAPPAGLWIDRIDAKGNAVAAEVPASILYHLTAALTQYLDATEGATIYTLPLHHPADFHRAPAVAYRDLLEALSRSPGGRDRVFFVRPTPIGDVLPPARCR